MVSATQICSQNILIATLGAEAQVITLALDSLLGRGVTIQYVEVVHTHPEQEPIRSALIRLANEFQYFSGYHTIQYRTHCLLLRGQALSDVANSEQIDAAFRQFYWLLHQHKEQGRSIQLCLAGGRKTMSLFAQAAAQWVLDEQDAIWHLISSPELIASRQMHSEDLSQIQLVPIPHAFPSPNHKDSATQVFLTQLPPAERELALLLLNEGLSNAQLAQRLHKSTSTIANQLSNLYRKLEEHYHLPSSPDRAMFIALLKQSPYIGSLT